MRFPGRYVWIFWPAFWAMVSGDAEHLWNPFHDKPDLMNPPALHRDDFAHAAELPDARGIRFYV